MTGHDLGDLLAAAACTAERRAPLADPVAALGRARRRREQRRGHLAVLAFVVFALGLQLWPADALGAARSPGSPPTAVTAVATPASAVADVQTRRHG